MAGTSPSKQTSKAKHQSPAVPPKPVEVTIYAQFPDPWLGNEHAEVAALRDKRDANNMRWEPTSTAFRATCLAHTKLASECDDFSTFAGPILKQQPRSISRLNLITHANPGLFALSGYLKVTEKSTVVYLGTQPNQTDNPQGYSSRQIDGDLIDWLNGRLNTSTDPDQPTGKWYRDEIRKRFRADAEFWIYGCHGGAGTGLELLIAIAAAFNVTTRGFRDPVRFDPTYSPEFATQGVRDRVVSRNRTYYNTDPGEAQAGFKHLTSDAVGAKPRTPTE